VRPSPSCLPAVRARRRRHTSAVTHAAAPAQHQHPLSHTVTVDSSQGKATVCGGGPHAWARAASLSLSSSQSLAGSSSTSVSNSVSVSATRARRRGVGPGGPGPSLARLLIYPNRQTKPAAASPCACCSSLPLRLLFCDCAQQCSCTDAENGHTAPVALAAGRGTAHLPQPRAVPVTRHNDRDIQALHKTKHGCAHNAAQDRPFLAGSTAAQARAMPVQLPANMIRAALEKRAEQGCVTAKEAAPATGSATPGAAYGTCSSNNSGYVRRVNCTHRACDPTACCSTPA
jgi:hypothetical protein